MVPLGTGWHKGGDHSSSTEGGTACGRNAITHLLKRERGQVDAERAFDHDNRTFDTSLQHLDAGKWAKENLLEVKIRDLQ